MAEKGYACVFRRHALSVVRDTDFLRPAAADFYLDPRRTGVQRVFHQLLDYRCRPIHDFPRRDEVGDMRRKNIDNAQGFSFFL